MLNLPLPTNIDPNDLLSGKTEILHGASGVYSLAWQTGEPHFGWSKNLGKRLQRFGRLFQAEDTAGQPTVPLALRSVQCWRTNSQLEQLLTLYACTKEAFPHDYVKRLRLRRPWFVSLVDEQAWARLAVSQRIASPLPLQMGPFTSRDGAAQFEDAASALVHLRRCSEPLHPHPLDPGCIYGEIGQCSRPCQAAVDARTYGAETALLRGLLTDGLETYLNELEVRRTQASESLDFEGAATLHKRLEKAEHLQSLCRDDLRNVPFFDGLALTPSGQANRIRIWPMLGARWRASLEADIANKAEMDGVFDQIGHTLALRDDDDTRVNSGEEQSDHLALFLRWHRSSFHKEVWLPLLPERPLRKASLTRACKRVLTNAT